MLNKCLVLLCVVGLCASYGFGAPVTAYWKGNNYHDNVYPYGFRDGYYWSTSAVPDSDDRAIFISSATSYFPSGSSTEVRLTDGVDVTVASLEFRGVNPYTVTLDLRGATLNATSTSTARNIIGDSLTSGYASLYVRSTGAAGANGLLSFGQLTVGDGAGAMGLVGLIASKMNVGATGMTVGRSGTGMFSVTTNSTLVSAGACNVGLNEGSNGTFRVLTNSSAQVADMVIGGGAASGGTGLLTVASGGSFKSMAGITVWGNGALSIDAGLVEATSFLDLKDASSASFVLNSAGAPALVTVGTNVMLGQNVQLALSLGSGASFNDNDFVSLITFGGNVTGTFAGYDEGHVIDVSGQQFRLTYAGGQDGKTIGLTAIPEPGTLGLLTMAGAFCLRRFRR